MSVTLVHPENVIKVDVHHQVAVGQGTRTVYLAGQIAWDVDGNPVGGDDLTAQTEQAFLNVARALEAVGASTDDLARVTVYVVGLDREKTGQIVAGRDRAAAALGVTFQQPGTYIGVSSLFSPEFLIEVEAVAVVD